MQHIWRSFSLRRRCSQPFQIKAPGPDGFPMTFRQLSWDFVKEEVMGILMKGAVS